MRVFKDKTISELKELIDHFQSEYKLIRQERKAQRVEWELISDEDLRLPEHDELRRQIHASYQTQNNIAYDLKCVKNELNIRGLR